MLANKNNAEPCGYIWKDTNGALRDITKMTTQHLFDTTRMLWNIYSDENKKYNHSSYRVTPFFSNGYVVKSLYEILPVIAVRQNLSEWQSIRINLMLNYFTEKEVNKCKK